MNGLNDIFKEINSHFEGGIPRELPNKMQLSKAIEIAEKYMQWKSGEVDIYPAPVSKINDSLTTLILHAKKTQNAK